MAKKGEACRAGRQGLDPRRPGASAIRLRSVPKPYQPGSITRDWDQANTQGMARRSAIGWTAVREAGRLPIFRSAISLTGVDWRK